MQISSDSVGIAFELGVGRNAVEEDDGRLVREAMGCSFKVVMERAGRCLYARRKTFWPELAMQCRHSVNSFL